MSSKPTHRLAKFFEELQQAQGGRVFSKMGEETDAQRLKRRLRGENRGIEGDVIAQEQDVCLLLLCNDPGIQSRAHGKILRSAEAGNPYPVVWAAMFAPEKYARLAAAYLQRKLHERGYTIFC